MVKYLIVYLLIINITGFCFMKADKSFSKIEGKRRIPEKTLMWIAALGGDVGIYCGMKRFRHKTLHNKFRYGVPAIFILHLVLFILYMVKKRMEYIGV
ncbi:MAG: DUF1294 domain-containing protein [Oscillospiraceae bacterium]|nr:DUF1294 domain-containing protein [Oscillospiraceae bacterium]